MERDMSHWNPAIARTNPVVASSASTAASLLRGLQTFVLAVTCSTLMACGGGGSSDGTPPPVAVDALAACAALNGKQVPASAIGLATRGALVTSATIGPRPPANASGESCLVNGQIDSVAASAQPIKFAIGLPSSWNNRSVHLGGGGWAGFLTSPTGTASFSAAPPPQVARG